MNNVEELLKEVNSRLNDEPCIKEYFRLKKIIEEDDKLMKLDKDVREHQSKMCQNQNNDEIYFKEKALYESSLKELESNPIYQDFIEIKKEVNALLIDIHDILS